MKNKFLKYTGLGFLFSRPKKVYRYSKDKVVKSLRVQLVLTFGVCTLAGMMVAGITNPIFDNWSREPYITYTNGMDRIDWETKMIVDDISEREKVPNERTMQSVFDNIERQASPNLQMKVMLVDESGKVLYKTKNANTEKVNLHDIIQEIMYYRYDPSKAERKEYYSYFPVTLEGKPAYLIVSGIPQPSIEYMERGSFFSILAGFATFLALFYYLTKRKMRRIEEVSNGLLEISTGNLDFRVEEKGEDELASLARNINFMARTLQAEIEKERAAERTKNELITNVSHDLRTPLTSIMGYLRLLKDDPMISEQKQSEYVQIAFNKSEQLKGLIEDLFEYTKISSDGHKLNKERVCLNEMIDQLTEEWVAAAEESDIVLKTDLPSEKINVYIDADKMVRVFENLLGNAIKYSHKPGEVLIKMNPEEAAVTIAVENKGEPISQKDLSRLFERFYKVEQSRTSSSEGSGLGLAIAKSIVDLHDGEIWAESEDEQIRFLLKLKRV